MSDVEDSFLPFVRNDQYGKMGYAPQTLLETIRLAFFSLTILPLKVVGTVTCIVGFYLVCRLFQCFPDAVQTAWIPRFGKFYTRACLACLGFFQITWVKLPRASWDKRTDLVRAAGIVSNHCSWVDILVHMSRYFPSFVARGGTEKLPLIGPIRYRPIFLYGRANLSSLSGVQERLVSKSPDIVQYYLWWQPQGELVFQCAGKCFLREMLLSLPCSRHMDCLYVERELRNSNTQVYLSCTFKRGKRVARSAIEEILASRE